MCPGVALERSNESAARVSGTSAETAYAMTRSAKTWILVLGGIAIVLVAMFVTSIYFIVRSGVTRPFDNMFGDQHLKTTVAIVELHKIRYGVYPRHLSELRFTGEWDAIALGSVSYCVSEDQKSYFVEVVRGWARKPDLTLPSEFWQGTGFNKGIGPCR